MQQQPAPDHGNLQAAGHTISPRENSRPNVPAYISRYRNRFRIPPVVPSTKKKKKKFEKQKLLITSWHNRKAAKKRQLLSLIGHLAHACKVVPPGRTFLRRIINLSCVPKDLDHWLRQLCTPQNPLKVHYPIHTH